MGHVDLTIAITTYNRAEMVSRAVRSALGQIAPGINSEILVIDDGSTDHTPKVLEKYFQDLEFVRLDSNVGVGGASAVALEAARGDLFLRLDSDDFLSSTFVLQTAPIMLQNPGVSVVSTDLEMIDGFEIPLKRLSRESWEAVCDFGAGLVFRTHQLREVGGYDPTLRTREDLDLILRLRHRGIERFHLPLPLYRRRMHSGNLSSLEEHTTEKKRILDEYR